MSNSDTKSIDHTKLEDVLAFVVATSLCALGVQFLAFNQLITGQTAGLGVFLAYLTDIRFGIWFFVINLPFYILAKIKMGWAFTIKSFIAVALFSLLSEFLSSVMDISTLPVPVGAALSGLLIGLGLVVIIRHGASLGGIGVLALYLQDSTGFRAGWTQLIFDVLLFGVALLVFPISTVLWSLVGAALTNVIIAFNHRKDRYVAR